MHIEKVTLTNFRCFGKNPTTIQLDERFTAFVGANGTGKTAVFIALRRMFGINREDSQVLPEDFHVPLNETKSPASRKLSIDVVIGFSELKEGEDTDIADYDRGGECGVPLDQHSYTVPEFFRHMAVTEDGNPKCRFLLDATWRNDGSLEGTVEQSLWAIFKLGEEYGDQDRIRLQQKDRKRIEVIYVPVSRDETRHLTTVLKSRLWRAAQWTDELRMSVREAADKIKKQFREESVVAEIERAVRDYWSYLHRGDLDTKTILQPIDSDLAQFLSKAQLVFSPSEFDRERSADQLSDGQRSLLHIALTAATVDIEKKITFGELSKEFDIDRVRLPSLTLLVVEEPENSLSPHFLSRIVSQMDKIGTESRAQCLVSSHSASVLRRIDPRSVRHFRIDQASRTALVNSLKLPGDDNEEASFVRGAVKAYPELYFARFVVLGEGSSEEIVIPMLAQAEGISIDQSLVSVVPLGGRHVHHFWRLLEDLKIPYATLLDLDKGRLRGGGKCLRTVCQKLKTFRRRELKDLDQFENIEALDNLGRDDLRSAVQTLEDHGVYFCYPLDLDMALLTAFKSAYKHLESGEIGPSDEPDFRVLLKSVLGSEKDIAFYKGWENRMKWYRYRFQGRSKPNTHLRTLSRIDECELKANMPKELRALVFRIRDAVGD